MRARNLPTPLDGVDVVCVDLDGVIYRGSAEIQYAVESLVRVAESRHLAYITNNASRTDENVAEKLTNFGLPTRAEDVVTSPQAAVRLLAEHVPFGSLVLVVGGAGLTVELERAGYSITRKASDNPAVVVQGFAPEVGWIDLAEASVALQGGIPWIATNTDWTLPVAHGIAPGNGTLVAAVHTAVGRLPIVAGKPETPIFNEAVSRFSAVSPLFIGDRLDTDIVGANRAGMRSAFVLTGVDRPKHLLAAGTDSRPHFILRDLRELHESYPSTEWAKGQRIARVRTARVALVGQCVTIVNRGDSPTDLLRAACALIWNSGQPIYGLDVPAELYEEA